MGMEEEGIGDGWERKMGGLGGEDEEEAPTGISDE